MPTRQTPRFIWIFVYPSGRNITRYTRAQRRKMLVNGLCAAFPGYSKAEMAGVLEACGFAPTIRGETLSLDSFAALANELARRAQA